MKYDPMRILLMLLSVTLLVPRTGSAQPSSDLPVPEKSLDVGTQNYVADISMGGRNLKMNISRTVEKLDQGWRVTERAQGPMGEVVDTEILSAPLLTPVERKLSQGPVRFDLSYTDETVDGTLVMQGQERRVSIDLEGPIFSDGAGAHLVIAALPLEDGYAAEYRTLDLVAQKDRLMQLSVTGTETTTVPAGTFETFRVEISSAAGDPGSTTLWIDRSSRQVVKTEASLPQLGGATIVSELQGESVGAD